MIYIVLAVVAVILLVFFNPSANNIRKLNKLIYDDPALRVYILMVEGWDYSYFDNGGLKIIMPPGQCIKEIFFTYKGKRPTNEDIEHLYKELTRIKGRKY